MTRKLAFLLATVMLITCLPMSAMAASTNTITPRVYGGNKFLALEAGVKAGNGTFSDGVKTNDVESWVEGGYLQIVANDDIPAGHMFRVSLNNAKFAYAQNAGDTNKMIPLMSFGPATGTDGKLTEADVTTRNMRSIESVENFTDALTIGNLATAKASINPAAENSSSELTITSDTVVPAPLTSGLLTVIGDTTIDKSKGALFSGGVYIRFPAYNETNGKYDDAPYIMVLDYDLKGAVIKTADSLNRDDKIKIPLATVLTGDDEYTVSIEGNPYISSGTYTFAENMTPETKVTVIEEKTVVDTVVPLGDIVIREQKLHSIKPNGALSLKAPAGYIFDITGVKVALDLDLRWASGASDDGVANNDYTINYKDAGTGTEDKSEIELQLKGVIPSQTIMGALIINGLGLEFTGQYNTGDNREISLNLKDISTPPYKSFTDERFKVGNLGYYTVTFKDYDNRVIKTQIVAEGTDATEPTDPSRTGYTFASWNATFNNVTADLTVLATYNINMYDVKFNAQDGTNLSTQRIRHGGTAFTPTPPVISGLVFSEWQDAGGKVISDFTNITAPLTVTAVYVPTTQFTVVFKNYDGVVLQTQMVDGGSNAVPPTVNPVKPGYDFSGWDRPINNVTTNLEVTARFIKKAGTQYIEVADDYNLQNNSFSGDYVISADNVVVRNLYLSGNLYIFANIVTIESGTINGNVNIYTPNAQDVIIKSAYISGNVNVEQSVGNGDIRIDGTTVRGTIVVKGGGQNSIDIISSTVAAVEVDKALGANTETVSIKVSNSDIKTTKIKSAVNIVVNDTPGAAGKQTTTFGVVSLDNSIPSGSAIGLDGAVTNVILNANKIEVNLAPASKITNLQVMNNVKDVDITGTGTIDKAIIDTASSSVFTTTATVTTTEAPSTTKHTITVTKDTADGTVSGGGEYIQGYIATVVAVPNNEYKFDGWYEGGQKVNEADATYSFTVAGDRALTAKFSKMAGYETGQTTKPGTGSSGSPNPGSGGSSGSSNVTISGTGGSVGAKASISGGTATLSITQSQIDKAADEGEGAVTVDLSNVSGSINTVVLPSEIITSGSVSSLTITLKSGSFSFDNEALSKISELVSDGNVTISLKDVTATSQSGKNINAEAVFEITMASGSKNISDFGDGQILITVAFTPRAGRNADGYYIVYIAADGTPTKVDGSRYNPDTGAMEMIRSSFSTYAIVWEGDEAPSPTPSFFDDVREGSWYFDSVKYVYDNGLMSGMTNTVFEPNTLMSRAMLVTVLWRLEGGPNAGASHFTDLSQSWYVQAVNWAAENDIVSGYSEEVFAPADNITREQLAAVFYRYYLYKGGEPINTTDLSIFGDAMEISPWATDGVGWAVDEGLIQGKGESRLDPIGNATRAEVAAVLTRYIR